MQIQKIQNQEAEQKVVISNRNRLEMSAVEDVISFSETEVVLAAEPGRVIIKGSGFKIESLAPENGRLCLLGSICSLEFKRAAKDGFIKSIFK